MKVPHAPLIGRRTILSGSAAILSTPWIRSASAAEDAIKLGLVFAKQGTWTEQGEQLVNGARIALEQVGSKALGRPVELVWLDEPSPQVAQQNMQKLVEEEKVAAVIGGTNSGTSLAMASVAKRAKVPYITPNAAAREITGKDCNRYTFRVLTTTPVASRAMAPHLTAIGKKWYFLTASYAFGQDIYASMKGLLDEAGGRELGHDNTPLGTTDFSSFILKIRSARPDVVVAGLPGGDLSTFLKQYGEMGMKGRIPVACPIIGDADLWAVGPQAATGIYGKPWHFSDPTNPEADRTFAAAYQTRHNKPAADKAWLGWMSMRTLLGGIEKAKSVKPQEIVAALETARFPDGVVDAYYRAWDHQMLRRCLVMKVKEQITDRWDWLDLLAQAPEKPSDLEALYGTPAEIGCQMEGA
ncbi:ABC transporter substrate-binding protein (plasmid) [Roseomonas sp. FDAARGOS_362]|uniref:ABC transporter substrate-binding protein n=1 Tax=Roseomonas TaxID=125216 RepID=UPI000C185B40|nr:MULTISPECIES: ABC transporter substrate-binding protein [Roseomonas]ATR19498.1 ABC transporter substrate-binding protein [Roseomonas sp. FDAARGOS_362]MDT8351875.1 ABC transporter substrate-binding protein [Roseomonas mucosa]